MSAILEYPIDFQRYIEERLREIDDLDERKFVKKLLLEGLGQVIQCTESKYQQLERRVYEEFEIADNQYEVVLTVVKRNHYDPTNGALFPVTEVDVEERILEETLSEEGRHWLGCIFLEAADDRQREFQDRKNFSGTLVHPEEKASPITGLGEPYCDGTFFCFKNGMQDILDVLGEILDESED